ncbi:MAG: LysE family transporter [Pseudomonadota bacterium]
MDTVIVLLSVFAVFIPALILPGPDFVGVVRMSVTHGTRAGLVTTLGVTLGLGTYASLSLIGLSAILIQYQWLAWLVRILGGAYLIYLGVQLLRTSSAPIGTRGDLEHGNAPISRTQALRFGYLVTLTNPKAVVLFASVFATAVTPQTPIWLMAVMIGLVMLAAFVWYSVVSLFMSSAPVVRRFERARQWVERFAGVCFVAFGGKVMSDARNPVGV